MVLEELGRFRDYKYVTLSADHGNVSQRIYYFKVTAIDTCGAPNESSDSNVWNE